VLHTRYFDACYVEFFDERIECDMFWQILIGDMLSSLMREQSATMWLIFKEVHIIVGFFV
jgi:hypothetical protein